MTPRTPEDAASLLCPVARTFASKEAKPGCQGPACAAWRWSPILAADPRITAAIKTIIAELGGGKLRSQEAWAILMKDRAKYGVPIKPEAGYCGMGGPL
jgi:hypothetical protein